MSTSFLVRLGVCCLLATLTSGNIVDTKNKKRGFFSKIKCSVFGSGCPSDEEKFNYGVLLDAGSSSTKLKVYRVIPADPLPGIEIIFSERYDPGLGDVKDVRTYLVNMLEVAKQNVPQSKQKDTPIYLFATAGLRFLNAQDATDLLDNTKSVLSDSSVSPFIYKAAGVGILSGEEEGVYAWVAANYLQGFFAQKKPDSEAVGILEMGGGSTQITFIPRNPLYDGEFQVSVLGRTYELYVHSYLQFGINAINLWVAQILSEKSPGSSSVDDPCMLQVILGKYPTITGDESDVKLEDGTELKLVGSSDASECKTILEEILAPATGLRCEPKPCAIGSVYQPSIENIQFFATQGFTYAPNTLKVVGDDQVLHVDKLEEAATDFCSKSLSEAVDSGVKENRASTTCLMGLYIPTLFTHSYRFAPDTENIKVTSNIGNDTIDWSLGAMVIELTGNKVTRRRR